MPELVRFETPDGYPLLVEVESHEAGVERVTRRGPEDVIVASTRLEDAVARVRPALRSLTELLRDLSPDQHEIEFGIKLNSEAGVVIAKTSVEGHFNVKLIWNRSTRPEERRPDDHLGTSAVAGEDSSGA